MKYSLPLSLLQNTNPIHHSDYWLSLYVSQIHLLTWSLQWPSHYQSWLSLIVLAETTLHYDTVKTLPRLPDTYVLNDWKISRLTSKPQKCIYSLCLSKVKEDNFCLFLFSRMLKCQGTHTIESPNSTYSLFLLLIHKLLSILY